MDPEDCGFPADIAKPIINQTRMKILKLLRKRRYNISEISKLLELSKPLVLYHIRILEDAGYVRRVENGRKWVYYELTDVGKAMWKWLRIKMIIPIIGGAVALVLIAISGFRRPEQPPEMGGINVLAYVSFFIAFLLLLILIFYYKYKKKFRLKNQNIWGA